MQLIDTHSHLDFDDFAHDRAHVLAKAKAQGLSHIVVLGVTQARWAALWAQVESEPMLYGALGLHPAFLAQHSEGDIAHLRAWLTRLAGHTKLCAVGECGLDYFLEHLDQAAQQSLFEAQLALACEFDLPVLLHVRRAHAQALATLKRYKPARGGIVHAFSGSLEQAREYAKLGFKVGLGGAGTWPQALKMQRMIKALPDECIVLETDSPDMAPAMYPNMRNSPTHLPAICEALAAIRGIDAKALAALSSANARALFGWP